jgi:hypothetical protein
MLDTAVWLWQERDAAQAIAHALLMLHCCTGVCGKDIAWGSITHGIVAAKHKAAVLHVVL